MEWCCIRPHFSCVVHQGIPESHRVYWTVGFCVTIGLALRTMLFQLKLTPPHAASSSRGLQAGSALEWTIEGFDLRAILSNRFTLVGWFGCCANSVFVCRTNRRAAGKTAVFVLKSPTVAQNSIRRLVHDRHKPLLSEQLPKNLFVKIYGVCEERITALPDLPPPVRAILPVERHDEACLWIATQYLPGTLRDFRDHFVHKDGVATMNAVVAIGFMRNLLHICEWLEKRSLFLFDFKLENFFVRSNGDLILGDLDSVFRARVPPSHRTPDGCGEASAGESMVRDFPVRAAHKH